MRRKKRNPKTILQLPDLEQSKKAVLNRLPPMSSRRSMATPSGTSSGVACSEPRLSFSKKVVTRYRIALEHFLHLTSVEGGLLGLINSTRGNVTAKLPRCPIMGWL